MKKKKLLPLIIAASIYAPLTGAETKPYSDLDEQQPNQNIKSTSNNQNSGFLLPPSNPDWTVIKGQDLFNVLSQWSYTAGWDLVWRSNLSYKMLAGASFSNKTFEQAVGNLFEAIGETNPKLYVTLYKGNKVILISSTPQF
ncbi:toxin co-regulated pilus biosynthesis Q family protein [Escherichia coli]|nr:toxin co-regulated pilus biosynthesis Q family protein [Escherichia coli]